MANNDTSGTARNFPLATWLSGGSLLIVFAALTVMAIASGIIVNRYAHRQALARSELAVSTVRDYLRRLGEGDLGVARTLADNPTLNRQLAEPLNALTFNIFLRGSCESVRATACAIVASTGPPGDNAAVVASSDSTRPVTALRICATSGRCCSISREMLSGMSWLSITPSTKRMYGGSSSASSEMKTRRT